MTGTSLDGIDISLVEIEGHGLDMRIKPLNHYNASLADLRDELSKVAQSEAISIGAYTKLNTKFTQAHIEALEPLLASESADLIAVHGQTLFHEPPNSCQMFNPLSWLIL